MPTIYGTNDNFDEIRTLVAAELTALIANMATNSIVPALAAVYTTHTGTPNMSFPCATIRVTQMDSDPVHQHSSPVGPRLRAVATVQIRILIGYVNAYYDDIKIGRLMTSVINWFSEQRKLSARYRIWSDGMCRAEMAEPFADTQTLGGVVTFQVMALNEYSAL
jgi:hypothetical protein